ncbi:MAG: ribose 5-phosphate isomerase B [Phycisphaerales bacterium]|nr:MAG: ribose 5-phosphate isomerase B [Phycisphaerales bacterium]
MTKIALSADHRGAEAARAIADRLQKKGHQPELVGACNDEPCDYPERAFDVATAVADGHADLGVLICGTGIGMAIAANKVPGIRAAVVHDELTAQLSRTHNNANILCLSADLLGLARIEKIVDAWLDAQFEGGRHQRRIDKIHAIERGEDPRAPA